MAACSAAWRVEPSEARFPAQDLVRVPVDWLGRTKPVIPKAY